MNVLLVDLGSNRAELNEPLGIELIAGKILRDIKGINVDLKWLLLEDINLNTFDKYDLIGLSAKLGTYNILKTILSDKIVESFQTKIFVGGPISTFGYKELLAEYQNIICVRGEGETSFTKICEFYKKNNSLENINYDAIPNLAYRKNGTIFETIRITEDLSNPPHPYRLYNKDILLKKGIARIEASRGCSWSNCDFCSVSEHYSVKAWRPYPIKYIIDELVELSNNGILSPYFTDEDFIGGNFERAILLANEIIIAKNNGLINPKMNFFFDAKITDIINKKSYTVLDLWREAGLREIFVGLESGSKNQLKRYGKAATPDKNFQAIEVLKKLGIQIDTGYILFDPEMNFSELLENIEYIKKINLSHMDARSIKKMRAHPFTKLTENYFNNSIIIGKLNLDLLYYPIQFKDEKVISAMNYFENWEKKYSEQVFDLQAMCRGEVGDENLRIKLKKQLSEIRQIDFELLNYYVKYLQCNSLASDLYDIEKNYEFKKKQILDNLTFS